MVIASWSEMSVSEHFVQFCESDEFLVKSVSAFIGTGLMAGNTCIVLATNSHRESLDEQLKEDGLIVGVAQARGRYISLDAATTLPKIMVNGMPDPALFASVIGSIVAQAVKGGRHVRIFGELVALLWAEGNRAAAVRLEELWNDLARTYPFALYCAYPLHGFDREAYGSEFTEICEQHSHVIPAESYTQLSTPDERLRAITVLQQKATALAAGREERQIGQALIHLITNAINFSPETDTFIVRVNKERENASVIVNVSVQNCGAGPAPTFSFTLPEASLQHV